MVQRSVGSILIVTVGDCCGQTGSNGCGYAVYTMATTANPMSKNMLKDQINDSGMSPQQPATATIGQFSIRRIRRRIAQQLLLTHIYNLYYNCSYKRKLLEAEQGTEINFPHHY